MKSLGFCRFIICQWQWWLNLNRGLAIQMFLTYHIDSIVLYLTMPKLQQRVVWLFLPMKIEVMIKSLVIVLRIKVVNFPHYMDSKLLCWFYSNDHFLKCVLARSLNDVLSKKVEFANLSYNKTRAPLNYKKIAFA